MNVLDGLSVVVEDVHSHYRLVELRISALDQLVVKMLLIIQGIEALEYKVKEGVKVFRAGRGDKDVGVAKADRSSNGETKSGGLATSSSSSKGDGGLQRLLGDCFNKLQQTFGLVQGPKIQCKHWIIAVDMIQACEYGGQLGMEK